MLDEGTITGSNGKKADCRNLILILTTNAGAQEAEKNSIGFGSQEKDYSDKELKKFFTPEFRNRLDAVVKFNKLEKLAMKKIVTKFINEMNDLLKDKELRVNASEALIDHLVDIGFAGNYYDGQERHTGLIRHASTDQYYLFKNLTQELTGNNVVDINDPTFKLAEINAYLISGGLLTNATAISITANSTVNVAIVANTLALSTALAGTSEIGRAHV